jgi:feruloyl esterase
LGYAATRILMASPTNSPITVQSSPQWKRIGFLALLLPGLLLPTTSQAAYLHDSPLPAASTGRNQAGTKSNTNVTTDTKTCAALTGTTKVVSVTSAEFNSPSFNTFARGTAGPEITVHVPFCRVAGTLKPTAYSDIRFELWLPPRGDWNGKFAAVGSGGSLGAIEHQRIMNVLVRGYAAMSTDSGHESTSGSDESWALDHPERVADFGHRAEHLATVAAKALTARFYGREPQHAYFIGCSQGGHHGMMEAQRFPQDYDGIIAGAPVYDWVGEMTEQAWNARALGQTSAGALSKEKLQLLYKAVLNACGTDGIIEDPRRCSFDPAALKCNGRDQGSCLSDGEVAAIQKMYAGPKTSAGIQIYPGLARGGETGWYRLWSNPQKLGGSWLGFYRYMVFQTPSWDLSMMDFDRDPVRAQQKVGQALNPNNADLSGFAKRGGKLIVYHGWADDMVPSQTSVDYYDRVTAHVGAPTVAKFYRLFMIPGMWHCSSGPDVLFHSDQAAAVPLTSDRDMLTALEQWVEHGRAPNNFGTSLLTKDGNVESTHLICAYPKVAKYQGPGDIDDARSWKCLTN